MASDTKAAGLRAAARMAERYAKVTKLIPVWSAGMHAFAIVLRQKARKLERAKEVKRGR